MVAGPYRSAAINFPPLLAGNSQNGRAGARCDDVTFSRWDWPHCGSWIAVAAARAASTYPERPIRLIIPFPPGGGFDAIGRPWADRIKPLLGTIVVENQGGGGSSLGAASVAHARPDGYTLLLGGSSTHVTEAILKTRPLYDPMKDLDPISNIAVSRFALAIHPSIPANTLQEFIDYDKANRGKLSYGHAGVGSLNHLTGELFKSLAGTSRPVASALSRLGPGNRRRHRRPGCDGYAGRDRAADRISSHRQAAHSGRDQSCAPDRRARSTDRSRNAAGYGLAAIDRVVCSGRHVDGDHRADRRTQITRALAESGYQQMLVETGFEPDVNSSPEKFRQRIEDEIAKWTPIVTALGIKID